MKKIIILLTLSLHMSGQYIPEKVRQIMYDSASLCMPVHAVRFENYVYLFQVKGDTNLIRWDLIRKDKLYTDYWKATGVVMFFESMAEITVLSNMNMGYAQHYVAGEILGLGLNYGYYKLTKRKWLSFGLSCGTVAVIGATKELTDPYFNRTKNFKSGLATGLGGVLGAFKLRIVLK